MSFFSCETPADFYQKDNYIEKFYPSSKPLTRWWWFATEIKKEDVKHQLDWLKSNNFGGVEIAWVYPLYRYQRMYSRKYGREYPKDTTAQNWLSPEWTEIVAYTKLYSDSIGLACDFTFGSAWPSAASKLDSKYGSKIYGDSTFKQLLTFAWTFPDTQLVINHLDSNAFLQFSNPIKKALKPAMSGTKTALFTDSWEVKLNATNKIWTEGFEKVFYEKFGYDIIPYMELGLDSFPEVRYDYMLQLEEFVINGFYKPYVKACKEMSAFSRVQCLASPTDVMTTYSLVDIPESEAMLNNPNYSKIVSSSACLASKPIVSSETFTCMYGFPATYLREEQVADLKLVADALFAQGVNFHIYHGTPFNPKGSDTIDFFATTYFGPGGSLEPELPNFNRYIEKVSNILQKGKTYSDVAVYIPYEDGIMKGAYPADKQRVWVWGEYEMRYIDTPRELEGYHPLWINRHFLEESKFEQKKLRVGDAEFSALYVDVEYMDYRSLLRIYDLAKKGLPVCLKNNPKEPSKIKVKDYKSILKKLNSLENVSNEFEKVVNHSPFISGEVIPDYWCRVDKNGNYYIFLAQMKAKDLKYPLYSGQAYTDTSIILDLNFKMGKIKREEKVVFKPYQSVLLKISPTGNLEYLDINYIPKDPLVRPKEKQKMYF